MCCLITNFNPAKSDLSFKCPAKRDVAQHPATYENMNIAHFFTYRLIKKQRIRHDKRNSCKQFKRFMFLAKRRCPTKRYALQSPPADSSGPWRQAMKNNDILAKICAVLIQLIKTIYVSFIMLVFLTGRRVVVSLHQKCFILYSCLPAAQKFTCILTVTRYYLCKQLLVSLKF